MPAIAKIAFTSEDRVREAIHNFNADGFDSAAAKYSRGRPPKFTLPERIEEGRPHRRDLHGRVRTAEPIPRPGKQWARYRQR